VSAINWQKLEASARKALAKNAAEIEQSNRGTPGAKQTPRRKRSKDKRFGAGYGRAT
jgi:hypothetical protein